MIFDFTTKDSGKNFEFLPPENFKIEYKELDGLEGDPRAVQVFPTPQRYGGSLADDANHGQASDHDGMMAFRIGVSQAEAAKLMEAREEAVSASH